MSPKDVWSRLELRQGDITRLRVDAIVNAANARLAGGGGVDGAIHRAAGPKLLEACRELGGCETGDARLTPGFDLPARFVIHAVGPVYGDGRGGGPDLLASCYRRSLEIAAAECLRTVAFAAISTGVYGYPFEAATEIAFRTTADFSKENESIEHVTFVFFSNDAFQAAEAILDRLSTAG